MGLDKLGVLTVGTLVPKEGEHTLPQKTLLVIPPWSHETHRWGYFLRTKPSNEDYCFE